MAKKPDIIETSIFSQLLGNKVLRIEPEELGPINLEKEIAKREENKKEQKEAKHNFKQGDLVVPDTGIKNAFFFKMNMKLNANYKYHLANSAERTYFFKNVLDNRTSVENYNDIQTIAYEKYDYDKDKEKHPGTRKLL